jgi:Bardet-Biedl syndrome 1 protein
MKRDLALIEPPVAVCSFCMLFLFCFVLNTTLGMTETGPRQFAIAVASQNHIFVYKDLEPYYKFTLPLVNVQPEENQV